MKTDLHALARAIVEHAATLSSNQLPALADAAMKLLADNGEASRMRTFMGIVKRFSKRYGSTDVILETPSHIGEQESVAFKTMIETALGRPTVLETRTDPSLIGGARIRIGDDRFDYSLRGALQRLPGTFSFHS